MNYKKLRKLAVSATPGPWFRSKGICGDFDIMTYDIGPIGDRKDLEQYEDAFAYTITTNEDGAANGDFIAACDPNTIIDLLDEISTLKNKIKKLKAKK
jgi:hypothetical protein